MSSEREEALRRQFSTMTLEQVKSELRLRGARVTGRKAELVCRLVDYILNNDFGSVNASRFSSEQMERPSNDSYKDLTQHMLLRSPCQFFDDDKFTIFTAGNQTECSSLHKKLYQEQYLESLRMSSCGNYFRGHVHAAMKKHVSYFVDIKMDSMGHVIQTECECPVGGFPTAHCKHVIVCLLGLLDFSKGEPVLTRNTCTQTLQSFHKPTSGFNGSPVKVGDLVGSFPQNLRYDRGSVKMSEVFCGAALYANSLPAAQFVMPADPEAVEIEHDYLRKKGSEMFLESLHLTNVPESVIADLEKNSRGQNENAVWHRLRCRATASRMGQICRANGDCPKLAKQIVNPLKFDNVHTAYGRTYESQAIAKYEEATKNKVERCGFFISKEHPYIGASPDGLVGDHIVLEVKCPSMARGKAITPDIVKCLKENDDGTFNLKETHDFFYQVQCQMLCTGRAYCHFVVYTLKDIIVLCIERNDEVIEKIIEASTNFYVKHLKQEILDVKFYKNYKGIFKAKEYDQARD